MTWLINEKSIAKFKEALKKTANDENAFASFRGESGIREIVEGIPDVTGYGYYRKIVDKISQDELALIWDRATRNDAYGNPNVVQFTVGKAASTTMRYLWNIIDMNANNVMLDDADIVEVGGGYGGLCRMVHEFHKPKSYTIIDIPEAYKLAEKYLAKYDVYPKFVSAEDAAKFNDISVDTFVSNYALTELSRDQQREYVDGIMARASCGYITYNSQSSESRRQYSLEELKKVARGISSIHDENVKKSECRVLIWAKQQ